MAKFRDSGLRDDVVVESQATGEQVSESADRSIGAIIAETRNLSAEQVERILAHQRSHGVRFGEAAVALGFASTDDVMFALAQQFHYPYAPEERRKLSPELVALNQPFGVQAEGFRSIRSQIIMRLSTEGKERGGVAVISPDAKDGKTFFAANAAVALAQLGGRTLLVDADMRHPRQHEVFGIDNSAGLSGVLAGRAESKVIQQVIGVPSLFVLPVGITPPNPLELVERPAFGLLVRELVSKFDYVIFDTPAACYGTDCAVIASRCGSSLVVARKNRGRVDALQDLVSTVGETQTQLLGVVFNEF